MSDKEPRRRRKKKDQPKKDDVQSEEPSYVPQKQEARDSDQEMEDDHFVAAQHQPSKIAKVIFMLLFSALVVTMSIVFIALRDAERGPVDIFDMELHEPAIEGNRIHEEDMVVWNISEQYADQQQDIHIKDPEVSESPDLEEVLNDKIFYGNEENAEELQLEPASDVFEIFEENQFEGMNDWKERIHEDLPDDVDRSEDAASITESNEDEETRSTEIFAADQFHSADEFTEEQERDGIISEKEPERDGETVSEMEPVHEIETKRDEEAIFEIEPEKDEKTVSEIELVKNDETVFEIEPERGEETISEIEPERGEETISEIEPERDEEIVSEIEPERDVEIVSEVEEHSDVEDSLKKYDSDDDSSQFQSVDTTDENMNEVTDAERYTSDVEPSHLHYEKLDITNEEDFNIIDELDDADIILEKSPDKALLKYENLLRLYSSSPRALYGKAQALDKLAESQRSNTLLEQAIQSYQAVMNLELVPDKLYILAGTRAVDRMRFRGFVGKALKLELKMIERFPKNVEVKKQLAVGYLLIGQNKEAKKIFTEVLEQKPDDGFSKVHLGFILKVDEHKYSEAVKLMTEGIATREEGVIDGRFFLHLGDALSRIGKESEAMEIYEDGAKEGLFLSAYQRSLYNVKGLTSKPWWDPMKTPYSKFIQLLEDKWIVIKNEALSLIDDSQSGFLPESESLQDTGDWKQYELFTRGNKHPRNCNEAPQTCALIDQMSDAAGCKRGQVKFSIMQAGTHVWAHCGPTNCRLRSHLGLVVPPGAKIRVANETREWQEGKVLMFDDSYEHEVWHEGKSLRLVLIVDFWHPELTVYQKSSLSPI